MADIYQVVRKRHVRILVKLPLNHADISSRLLILVSSCSRVLYAPVVAMGCGSREYLYSYKRESRGCDYTRCSSPRLKTLEKSPLLFGVFYLALSLFFSHVPSKVSSQRQPLVVWVAPKCCPPPRPSSCHFTHRYIISNSRICQWRDPMIRQRIV